MRGRTLSIGQMCVRAMTGPGHARYMLVSEKLLL